VGALSDWSCAAPSNWMGAPSEATGLQFQMMASLASVAPLVYRVGSPAGRPMVSARCRFDVCVQRQAS
jgi:hypothetical protein